MTGNHGKQAGQERFCIWGERSSWEFWGGVEVESERLTEGSCQPARMGLVGGGAGRIQPMLLTISEIIQQGNYLFLEFCYLIPFISLLTHMPLLFL